MCETKEREGLCVPCLEKFSINSSKFGVSRDEVGTGTGSQQLSEVTPLLHTESSW